MSEACHLQQVPPSARVRALSRQFSQQDQPAPQARVLARSLTSTPTSGRGHAMSSIWEQTPTTAAILTQPSADGLASDSVSDKASVQALDSAPKQASDKTSVVAGRALRKTASAATPAFALGSSNNSSAAGPPFSHSITGTAQQKQTTPSVVAMFAFGSSKVPTSSGGKAQVPFTFAAGADSAASAANAANAVGQLFGFGKETPPAAGVAFRGLVGSAFQLAASSSSALATPQLKGPIQALPDQDASEGAVSEDDMGSDTSKDADGEEGFALSADLLDSEAQQADAGHHSSADDSAADDQSGSDEDAAVTDAEEEQSAAGGQSDEEDNESEADADKSEAEGHQSKTEGDQSEAEDEESFPDNDAAEDSTAAAQSADDQQEEEGEEESAEGDEVVCSICKSKEFQMTGIKPCCRQENFK